MGEHAQRRGSTGSLQPPATPARFNAVDHDYDAAAHHDHNATPDYDHNYDAAAHYDYNNPTAVDHYGQAWCSHRRSKLPPRLRFRGVRDQPQPKQGAQAFCVA